MREKGVTEETEKPLNKIFFKREEYCKTEKKMI